jgi:hypothetical protein
MEESWTVLPTKIFTKAHKQRVQSMVLVHLVVLDSRNGLDAGSEMKEKIRSERQDLQKRRLVVNKRASARVSNDRRTRDCQDGDISLFSLH